MLDKILNKIHERLNKSEKNSAPTLNWKSLLGEIEDITEGQSVFLDTRSNGLVPLNEILEEDIIGVVVTPAKPGIKSWDTEAPAQEIVTRISNRTQREVLLLLNRNPEQFVGYYAYLQ